MIYQADDKNLKELIEDGFSVVDFYTDTCGPCKMLAPILNRLESELPFINLVKVNLSKTPEYRNEYKVNGVPTLLFVKDGEICERRLGVMNLEQLEATIGKYMYD